MYIHTDVYALCWVCVEHEVMKLSLLCVVYPSGVRNKKWKASTKRWTAMASKWDAQIWYATPMQPILSALHGQSILFINNTMAWDQKQITRGQDTHVSPPNIWITASGLNISKIAGLQPLWLHPTQSVHVAPNKSRDRWQGAYFKARSWLPGIGFTTSSGPNTISNGHSDTRMECYWPLSSTKVDKGGMWVWRQQLRSREVRYSGCCTMEHDWVGGLNMVVKAGILGHRRPIIAVIDGTLMENHIIDQILQ